MCGLAVLALTQYSGSLLNISLLWEGCLFHCIYLMNFIKSLKNEKIKLELTGEATLVPSANFRVKTMLFSKEGTL